MRSRFFLILGLAATIVTVSCSSASDEKLKTQQNATANGNANTVAISDGAELNASGRADANAASAVSADPLDSPANAMTGRLDRLKKGGETGPELDASVVALKNTKPAPDNSTFTSYLTDAGYEIRTFKNHPRLLKVEKKITSDGKQTLKIFLRGGKVVELPGQTINPLATAPAAFILQMAGVQDQSQPQSAPAGPPAVKKSGE
jgi:hypothetical protein